MKPTRTRSDTQWMRGLIIGMLAAFTMLVGACRDNSAHDVVLNAAGTAATVITVDTPAAIDQESAADYNNNVNGLITAQTLKSWIDDWAANHPPGITGRLVILQINNGPTGHEYITPRPATGVVTYSVVTKTRLIETRSDGVAQIISMVPDGPTMDRFFHDYGIDPTKDMLVWVMGTGGYLANMWMGRGWYMMRYWGVPKTHLALLDGGAYYGMPSYMGSTVSCDENNVSTSCLPGNGTFSVRNLPEDNTALQATLEDMMHIVRPTDVNDLHDGVFLWDARNIGQYSAGLIDESGTVPANYMSEFQNGGSQQGHPNGALDLNFTNMLDSTTGYSYKPKSELQAYLDGRVDANGKGFVDGTLQPVGPGRAYQPGDTVYTYCETTFRAMITGIVSGVILGKPTRFYDGAMYEWHTMSNIIAKNGLSILPIDSPWRTDLTNRSYFRPADSAAAVTTRVVTDPYAISADAIVRADREYKRGSGGSGSGGGVLPPPPNPCANAG